MVNKTITINPLKNSTPLGAVMAFLGVDRAIPLMHGCQGCSAFIRALLERHYREPVYIKTTALTETGAIMGGGEDVIVRGLKKSIEQWSPDTIGLITTGLTEVKGDDYSGAIKTFRRARPEYDCITVIPVSTPDYEGCLQEGYAKAVLAMIEQMVKRSDKSDSKLINLLPGSFLTPADVQELKDIVSAFGLTPIVLPDLSGSYDGHLEEEQDFIARGGIKASRIPKMAGACATFSFGESMRRSGELLNEKSGVKHTHFNTIFGLDAFDDFITSLSEISGAKAPVRFERERGQLLDAMLDAHFFISGKSFILGLEPDLMLNVSKIIDEMGGNITIAVTPVETPLLSNIKSEKVLTGDLSDLELPSFTADIIVSNSNASYIAKLSMRPLLRMGFPITDRLGINSKATVGYKGAMNLIFEMGNLLMESNIGGL